MTATPSSLALLHELIAFPSVSRSPNIALLERIQALLNQAGIASSLVCDPTDPGRANLFASTGPMDAPGIVLSGHTDVVPVQGQPWTSPPFEATQRDGRIYGRGSADMKGFVACAVHTMLQAADKPLQRPLHLALSYDEEIGCVGVRHLLQALRQRNLPAPLLCLVGEPTLMQIGLGHKGKSAYRARCCGQEGHSGLAPRFANAIHAAADLVSAIREVQSDLATTGPREAGYAIPYTTIHAGRIEGGKALNIVPGECVLDFEIRFVTDDHPDDVLACVREKTLVRMQQAAQLQGCTTAPAAPAIEQLVAYPGLRTASNAPGVQLLARCLPAHTPHTKVAFGTEGGLFQQLWDKTPVVVCGPGSIEVAHKADEYIELAQLDACDAMLAQLTDSLCLREGAG
ncbi:acetylornithine deacetylase [Lampropedia cohaerens]|uniref:Acetylornithine deacetylase n=1 Tax=Lampropedia cohaerens TaxID=1610491 RepID=A0A0U1PW46_9BURK|nr:acetylornithine deacetylase [Lampropedia cohaerens]KKW66762.1 acetylornithine deacetylase [Lampropedia cohaerens]